MCELCVTELPVTLPCSCSWLLIYGAMSKQQKIEFPFCNIRVVLECNKKKISFCSSNRGFMELFCKVYLCYVCKLYQMFGGKLK